MDEERVVTRRTEQTEVGGVPPVGYVTPPTYAPPPVYPAQPVYAPAPATATVSETAYVRRAGSNTTARRLVIFLFGILQGLLVVRVLLLLVAARESNSLVSAIYDISDVFVAPFRGILGHGAISAGRSALDIDATVAIIGWTIIELIILGLLNVFRRDVHTV